MSSSATVLGSTRGKTAAAAAEEDDGPHEVKMYHQVPPEYAMAAAWTRLTAAGEGLTDDSTNPVATYQLGIMRDFGVGAVPSATKAAALYRAAAEAGVPDAECNLGVLYEHGRGVGQSDVDALSCYRRAAAGGSAMAQYNLGVFHASPWALMHEPFVSQEKGQGGLVADMTAAEEWYRKAADQNLACAQYNLGVLRSMSSEDEALSWFQLAAEQGDTNGSFSLGCLLARRGDQDGAMTWWRKGADLGDTESAYYLGVCCERGFGKMEQNASEAALFHRTAAEAGHVRAANALGALYRRGFGVDQSDTDAVAWFQWAADQGLAEAQHNLGEMLERGLGVPEVDAAAAQELYDKAVAQGFVSSSGSCDAADVGAVACTSDGKDGSIRGDIHRDERSTAVMETDNGESPDDAGCPTEYGEAINVHASGE